MTGVTLFLTGAVAVFAYFAWAIRYHFVSARMPMPMRLVSVLAATTLLTGVVTILSRPPGMLQTVLSTLGVLTSLAIFHGAVRATRGRDLSLAFDPVVPSGIAKNGPYRWVRHPFYLSYMVFWASLLGAAPIWPMAGLSFALVGLYISSACAEERLILGSEQAESYRVAMQNAGFLWPRIVPPKVRR